MFSSSRFSSSFSAPTASEIAVVGAGESIVFVTFATSSILIVYW